MRILAVPNEGFSHLQTANSRKNTRASIVLLVLGLSAALLGLQHVAGRKVVLESFAQLERDADEKSLQQVVKAFEADLNQLAISLRDYAAWDDSYDYAESRDEQYIASNFVPETLTNMDVNIVWMIDTQDRDVVLLDHRDEKAGVERPASAEVSTLLRDNLSRIKKLAEGSEPLDRLLRTKDGLIAFAAHPLLKTGDVGPARGYLVFARRIDPDVLERTRETSQLPVAMYFSRASLAKLHPSVGKLWQDGSQTRLLREASADVMDGYAMLHDVQGAPAAMLETHFDRKLVASGHRTLRYLTWLIAATIGVFAIVVAWLLLRLERTWRARTASERRYRAVITQAQDTMLLADVSQRSILEVNPAAVSTLGYTEAELLSMSIEDLFVVTDGDTIRSVQPELHLAAAVDNSLQVRRKDQSLLEVEVSSSKLVIDDREVISFVLRDVSARKRAERALLANQGRLSHLAHHDALTGLLNRLGLETQLPGMVSEARRTGKFVAFLYLDIDHFKKINDISGHDFGDQLLKVAAERLRASVASTDLVVRMGGDEFVVVAGALPDADAASGIAQRVREKLALPIDLNGREINVTSTVGVSVFPDDGADYLVLLRNADVALYEAKEAGRDTFRRFVRSMTTRISERITTEQELRGALRDGQFYIEYQPVIDLQTSKVSSLEALVRWRHPTRGIIPPGKFIEVAEKAGMICELGEFVMRRACQQIRHWQEAGVPIVPIAVNVSSHQFERENIKDLVLRATGDAQVDPSLLHIEITESAIMHGHERQAAALSELRSIGVEVSVDDFGTGYSSLSYLKNLPIDCLKIDRAFVRDMVTSPNGEAIVTTVIQLAKSLGLHTIAEGVETLPQLRRLRMLGATMGQGFYFSPPLPAETCLRVLVESGMNRRLSDTTRLRALMPKPA
jgi:diguanylate cyclase (GGDEF)-like protein/PAS domain S-box-containing protein